LFFLPKNIFLLKSSLIKKSGEIEHITKADSYIDSKFGGTPTKTTDLNIKFKNDPKVYFLTPKHILIII